MHCGKQLCSQQWQTLTIQSGKSWKALAIYFASNLSYKQSGTFGVTSIRPRAFASHVSWRNCIPYEFMHTHPP